jgi:hypothetical protein
MEVREKEKKKKGHQESREQRRHWIATKLFEWAIYVPSEGFTKTGMICCRRGHHLLMSFDYEIRASKRTTSSCHVHRPTLFCIQKLSEEGMKNKMQSRQAKRKKKTSNEDIKGGK